MSSQVTPGVSQPKEKKRKNTNNEDKPRKKHAREPSELKVKHKRFDHEAPPILASSLGFSISNDAKFKTYEKRRGDKAELLLHSENHAKLDYTGRQNGDGGADDLLKHYVAIYDPDLREIEITEVPKVSVRSSLRAENEEMRATERSKTTGLSNRAKRDELNSEFGSKKAKKAIASKAENAVSSQNVPRGTSPTSTAAALRADPAALAVIDSMSAAVAAAPSKEAQQAELDAANPRPHHNPDAENIRDAYDIGVLVGEDVLKELKVKVWVDTIRRNEQVQVTSQFVSNRIVALALHGNKIRELKVLKYMLCLLNFVHALQSKGKSQRLPEREKLREAIGAESSVVDTIKQRFASGNEVTKYNMDSLYMHLAVLSLIIDDFETDIYELRKDLGMELSKMQKYFVEIGAKMATVTTKQAEKMKIDKAESSEHKIARLHLPLVFPKPRKAPTIKRKA